MSNVEYINKVLLEAFFVGIMTIIIGYVSGFVIGKFEKIDLPEVCKSWNKNFTMEKTLFLTGFLVHVFCEILHLNRWYCKNGIACTVA